MRLPILGRMTRIAARPKNPRRAGPSVRALGCELLETRRLLAQAACAEPMDDPELCLDRRAALVAESEEGEGEGGPGEGFPGEGAGSGLPGGEGESGSGDPNPTPPPTPPDSGSAPPATPSPGDGQVAVPPDANLGGSPATGGSSQSGSLPIIPSGHPRGDIAAPLASLHAFDSSYIFGNSASFLLRGETLRARNLRAPSDRLVDSGSADAVFASLDRDDSRTPPLSARLGTSGELSFWREAGAGALNAAWSSGCDSLEAERRADDEPFSEALARDFELISIQDATIGPEYRAQADASLPRAQHATSDSPGDTTGPSTALQSAVLSAMFAMAHHPVPQNGAPPGAPSNSRSAEFADLHCPVGDAGAATVEFLRPAGNSATYQAFEILVPPADELH